MEETVKMEKATIDDVAELKRQANETFPKLMVRQRRHMAAHRRLLVAGIVMTVATAVVFAAAAVAAHVPDAAYTVKLSHVAPWCLVALCVAQELFICACRRKCSAIECESMSRLLDTILLKTELNAIHGDDEKTDPVVEQ